MFDLMSLQITLHENPRYEILVDAFCEDCRYILKTESEGFEKNFLEGTEAPLHIFHHLFSRACLVEGCLCTQHLKRIPLKANLGRGSLGFTGKISDTEKRFLTRVLPSFVRWVFEGGDSPKMHRRRIRELTTSLTWVFNQQPYQTQKLHLTIDTIASVKLNKPLVITEKNVSNAENLIEFLDFQPNEYL